MSISSVSALPPALPQITQTQPQQPTTQAAAQPVSGGDSDNYNYGSNYNYSSNYNYGAVNIKA